MADFPFSTVACTGAFSFILLHVGRQPYAKSIDRPRRYRMCGGRRRRRRFMETITLDLRTAVTPLGSDSGDCIPVSAASSPLDRPTAAHKHIRAGRWSTYAGEETVSDGRTSAHVKVDRVLDATHENDRRTDNRSDDR